ncbi:MAG: hypothetical protein ACTS8Y_01425 [Arsenophonus sp. ER-EMS1-MAG3]
MALWEKKRDPEKKERMNVVRLKHERRPQRTSVQENEEDLATRRMRVWIECQSKG